MSRRQDNRTGPRPTKRTTTPSGAPDGDPAPLPLLYVLAFVLAASAAAQIAVLLNPEPMLFPKPMAGVILAVAALGLVSVVVMIVRGHRER